MCDLTFIELFEYLDSQGLVCPYPKHWCWLHDILINHYSDDMEIPPMPLILNGWMGSSNSAKNKRLRKQMQWALDHDVFDKASDCLLKIPSDGWLKGNRW